MKKSFQTSLILLLLVLLLSNNFLGGVSIGIAQQLNENNSTNRETQDKDLLVNEEEVESDIAAQHESTQADSKPVDENNNHNNYENSYSEEEIPIQEESVEESTGEDMLEPPLITPFVGNLNVDIDISPFKDEVDSGKSANYNLVLKTTGSQQEYTNAEVVVHLPINDYTEFNQDLKEMNV